MKQAKKNIMLWCMTLLCALSFSSLSYAAESTQSTILSGKIISTVTRAKALPFNAIIEEVLVKSGQEVGTNEILLKYSLTEEAERTLLKELARGAGTEDTHAQILTLQSQLSNLKAQSNKARQLAAAGLGSSQASARSASEVKLLQERITLLQQTLSKQETAYKQRLDELSDYFGTPVTGAANLPKLLVLTSPMDGHILSVAANVQAGAQLPMGAAPILVGKMNPMSIQIQVFEGEIGRIKVGSKASVTIPSLQDKAFEATVSQIAWTSTSLDVSQPSYYTVQLTIPNPNLELKPGFKAIVEFGSN